MTSKKAVVFIPLVLAAVFIAYGGGICWAQGEDNTKINERDTAQQEVTADEQGQTQQDLELTQAIRKAIVDNKSFSSYAHNVKVITNGGVVTLKGPVRSADEKAAVEMIAMQIAGTDRVRNEIGIASK